MSPEDALWGLGYAAPTVSRSYRSVTGDQVEEVDGAVAEETPIVLVYNQRPHAVMMGTSQDLVDFAYGFSLAERIVDFPSLIQGVRVVRHAMGIELHVDIPTQAAEALTARGRALVGRTGCGLCGVESISDALRLPAAVAPGEPIEVEALWRAASELPGRQLLNESTKAVHAAAFARADGSLVLVREDVGRHNALDKVIGALAREGIVAKNGFIVMTSRASYELVQKSAIAGVGCLAAVSRPTGLAIRLADALDITLVGLLRGESANVYTHPARLCHPAPAS